MKKRLQRTGTTIAWSVTILGKLCSFGCASLAAILISSSAANAQPLQLVSVPDSARIPAETGAGDSGAPIISADGRYALFASTANNLLVMGTNRPMPAVLP